MAGIIFLKTKNKEKIEDFYITTIGMSLWLEQADCVILKHGNLLLGFCARDEVDKNGIITFFYKEKYKVDEMYEKLKEVAIEEPKINDKYKIYHFFARDPEDRIVEFQSFLHPVDIPSY